MFKKLPWTMGHMEPPMEALWVKSSTCIIKVIPFIIFNLFNIILSSNLMQVSLLKKNVSNHFMLFNRVPFVYFSWMFHGLVSGYCVACELDLNLVFFVWTFPSFSALWKYLVVVVFMLMKFMFNHSKNQFSPPLCFVLT